jgi:quinone-modifying oxidoreductase subunit QmoA
VIKELDCASIVFATGWSPYDAAKMENLGFGKIKNVITNMMMERYASNSGPTAGKIVRPSDNKAIESIAFVQCAGSRDENHLGYCSAVCCMATLKQASYVREQYPEAQIYIFYIDLRAPGKYEAFLQKSQADPLIKMIKGKVAKIEQDSAGGVIVTAEDIEGGGRIHQTVDMVVLATGMEPGLKGSGLKVDIKYQEDGFVAAEGQSAGFYAAGVAKRPADVTTSLQDATAMALKGIQSTYK